MKTLIILSLACLSVTGLSASKYAPNYNNMTPYERQSLQNQQQQLSNQQQQLYQQRQQIQQEQNMESQRRLKEIMSRRP